MRSEFNTWYEGRPARIFTSVQMADAFAVRLRKADVSYRTKIILVRNRPPTIAVILVEWR
jgi:hypothetical protein